MKNKPIYITKTFLESLWNIGDKNLDVHINFLRLCIFMFSINNNENYTDIKLTPYYVWKHTYGYKDDIGNDKIIFNYNKFLNLISIPSTVYKYDSNKKILHFNLDHLQFYINWNRKKEWIKEHKNEEYNISPAIRISHNEWEIMKTATKNELKLYFYILYEKVRGPHSYITTSISELNNKLLYSYKDKKQLKILIKKHLNSLKNKNIISDYSFNKYDIKIKKYGKK